jgi:hypothetical protein
MEQLRPKLAVIAGLISGGVALAAAVALILFTLTAQKPDQPFPLWLIPVALGLAAVAISGLQLAKFNTWAQQGLLAFWMLAAVTAVTAGVAATAGSVPAWWDAVTKTVPFAAAVVALLAVSLAAAGLLAVASQPNSRLRYSTMVILSAGAALAVLLVVNLIAQSKDNFYRKDVQWLGQYGLSERSKKILGAIREPVKLTSMYSTSESNAGSAERASRVWELLSETHDLNPRIDIARAASDSDRADILARIAQQARDRAPAYDTLLKSFLKASPTLAQELSGEQKKWDQLAGRSYLDLWGAAAQLADILKGIVQDQDELSRRLPKDLAGLPDYAKLTDDVKTLCTHGKEGLANIDETLKMLGKIPAAVVANRAAAEKKLDALGLSLRLASRALAASSTTQAATQTTQATQPTDPGDLLKAFMAIIQDASDKAVNASQALDEVAGPENARFVRGSSAWLVGGDNNISIDASGMVQRYNISRAFLDVSEGLLRQRTVAQSVLQAATKEYQAKVLAELQTGMARNITSVDSLVADAKKAVGRLAKVDADTAEIFKQVEGGKYLKGPIDQFSVLLDQANKLPPLPASTLATDLTEENTVLIETADKTEAVRFDQVWPVRARPPGPAAPETAEQRVFNGDSAISSKVLTMTQKPCATVILAYMQLAPQMAQMGAEAGMTPQVLEEMQLRLRQANFRVKTWDLSTSDSPVEAADANEPAIPKVLIVLPPLDLPPMMQRQAESAGFGPKDIAKIRREIDSGDVAGAIFLAQFQPPMSPYAPPPHYGWNDYLMPDWGIEARTNYLLVPAERDETGQRFQLSAARLQYLPLSTFSDHAIGKPLQGQRVLWQFPVPVVEANQLPPGVKVEGLLTVPSYWTSTWATSNFQRIIEQFQETGSYVSPDYEHGDMAPPFDVAVAAKRVGDPNHGESPSRVVVLGMGSSLVDPFVQRPVINLKNNSIASEDPPRGNLDVVVNSAYWVCARDEYIASGPVQVQPIRKIGDVTYRVLWTLCVVGLPAILLCVGGLVLVLRRR